MEIKIKKNEFKQIIEKYYQAKINENLKVFLDITREGFQDDLTYKAYYEVELNIGPLHTKVKEDITKADIKAIFTELLKEEGYRVNDIYVNIAKHYQDLFFDANTNYFEIGDVTIYVDKIKNVTLELKGK